VRVIVGVDGSQQSAHALSWACRRAETCGDTVRAVCAWSLGASGEDWMAQPGGTAEGQRRAEQMLREAVEPVRGDHPAVNLETAVIEGRAVQVLVNLSADADLLVVGSRGRGASAGCCSGRSASNASTTPAAGDRSQVMARPTHIGPPPRPIAKVKEVSNNEIRETPTGGIDPSRDWREAGDLGITMIIGFRMIVATRPSEVMHGHLSLPLSC
jgi:nucleotide-binding universal stress UspA family protein